jgi:hypothetical protein
VNERDLYLKLVDLYAGRELPLELEDEMEWKAMGDPILSHEMSSLRRTVELLQESEVEFTEESNQRILMKLYARGAEFETTTPPPSHLQYHLPIQG